MLGWFRRLCLPPLRWSCSVVRPPPLFFSLAFSGFNLSGPGVLCWCSLSLFSCVPLFASWLSIFHFIFIVIFIFISSAPLRWGVCVYHLYRCKTSIYRRGTCIYVISLCRGAHVTCSANEADDMRQGYRSGTPDLRTCYG